MVKIRLGSIELELPVEQASAVLNEMQKEITKALGLLCEKELALFEKIAKNEGRVTVDELSEGDFERNVSPEHDQLRHLRDWRLIEQLRTPGGEVAGKRHGDNYPYVTDFGRLVLSLQHQQARNEKDSRPTSENSPSTHSGE